MSDGIGYLLPAGDTYEEDLECIILFYPNRRKYRQALFGSLDYLGTWLAWERDDEKRGQGAALSWKLANEATRECIAMGTCDTLLELLVQIEKNTRTCCGESNYVQYGPNIIVTTTIVPGSGGAPTHYGETAVADWDEWSEYVCYHAHAYVDDLIDTAEKLHTAVTIGGYVLDFIAHLFSIVQWRMVEDLVPVNFSVIQAIFNALGEAGIVNEFDDLADDFETSRDDIVCSLMQGTSLEAAVFAVVGSGVLWDTYYQWLDYETSTAIIYEGELPDVGYLTPIKKDDCVDCDQIGDYMTSVETFDLGAYTWTIKNGSVTAGATWGNGDWGVRMRYDGGVVRTSSPMLRTEVGLTTGDPAQTVTIKRVMFDYNMPSWPVAGELRLQFNGSGTPVNVDFPNVGVWTSVVYTLPTPVTCLYNGWAVQWMADLTGSGGYIHIDNLVVDFDAPA